MVVSTLQGPTGRYSSVNGEKSEGATYTPPGLARFVAEKMVGVWKGGMSDQPVRILDPAAGDGELLIALLNSLRARYSSLPIEVIGFEPNIAALETAQERLSRSFVEISLRLAPTDFLGYVLENFGVNHQLSFTAADSPPFDLVISNPPYVRTQIMGASQAQALGRQFGLTGRVDLYHAFMLAIARVVRAEAVSGMIVSNRFMTTRSGARVRRAILERLRVLSVWDFGDTKLFEAAVLPAVVLARGIQEERTESPIHFTSIYETKLPHRHIVADPIDAVSLDGVIQVSDGRRFNVRHGHLETDDQDEGVWRIANETTEEWLATVARNTWGTFGDIGRVRVGVKTCADSVFIRADWNDSPGGRPELLKPLTTHHAARRFKALTLSNPKMILYPHEVRQGQRQAVDLSLYPQSAAYLESHREILEGRTYVTKSGRKWFEIWVPQDPSSWDKPKLVFRDITRNPTFWVDLDGSVVNGDCYWLAADDSRGADLLWLATAVGNSSFIQQFYDYRFQNKLYAGRRRFMTQYVELFPLPDPTEELSQRIIAKAKDAYECAGTIEANVQDENLNRLIWEAFGLPLEEVNR